MVDAVVIGAGPNGLVAANLLADAGWSVTVLEAQEEPGGAVRSGALTLPGFVHDRFSSFYPLAAASPVIHDLELWRHGLSWRRHRVAVAHPTADGTCAFVSDDLDETAAGMDAFAAGDGDAWRSLMALWDRVGPSLVDALFTPFPPVRALGRLTAALGGPAPLLDFVRLGLQGVRGFGEAHFGGDGGPRMLAGNALHADLTPEQPGGALFGLVLCGLAHQVGFPFPAGGSGRLTDALVARLRANGGTVACGTRVTRVEVRKGRAAGVVTAAGEAIAARRAVLADVSAPALYLELLDEAHVGPEVRRALKRFEWGSGTFKVDWALREPIPWTAGRAREAGTVHVAEGMDALSVQASELARHRVPAEPFLVLGQHARADPSRVPDPANEVVWAYTHLPQGVAVPDEEAFADLLEAQVERLAPGFRDRVLARAVQPPSALQDADANLRDGAINNGSAQVHQQLVFRPIPGLGRAETTIPGLFLASAAIHPGGGVHGAPGSAAAQAALASRTGQRLRAAAQRRMVRPVL